MLDKLLKIKWLKSLIPVPEVVGIAINGTGLLVIGWPFPIT